MKKIYNLPKEIFIAVMAGSLAAYLLMMIYGPFIIKLAVNLALILTAAHFLKTYMSSKIVKEELKHDHYICIPDFCNEYRFKETILKRCLEKVCPNGIYSDDLDYFFENDEIFMYFNNAEAVQQQQKSDMTDIIHQTLSLLDQVAGFNDEFKSMCIRCRTLLQTISEYSRDEIPMKDVRTLKKRFLPTFNEVLGSYLEIALLPARTPSYLKIEKLAGQTINDAAVSFEQIYDSLLLNKSISLEGDMSAIHHLSAQYTDFFDLASQYLDQ